jgi:hypothetical protein
VTPVAGAIVMDQNAVDTTEWEDATLGTPGSPCVGGIALGWSQVGADPPPVHAIAAGASDEFFATPNYGSFGIVPGMIKARFRIADRGSGIGRWAIPATHSPVSGIARRSGSRPCGPVSP